MRATVTVKVLDEREGGSTIIVESDDAVTVHVHHVRFVEGREVRREFEAVLPDERAYPPLIP